MIIETNFYVLDRDLQERLKKDFKFLVVGGKVILRAPHRDMGQVKNKSEFHLLPDRCEVPNTFSFKQLIEDALNTICPQVPKDFEELPDHIQAQLKDNSEGQGMWKFMDLRIEEGMIIAVIKKI